MDQLPSLLRISVDVGWSQIEIGSLCMRGLEAVGDMGLPRQQAFAQVWKAPCPSLAFPQAFIGFLHTVSGSYLHLQTDSVAFLPGGLQAQRGF